MSNVGKKQYQVSAIDEKKRTSDRKNKYEQLENRQSLINVKIYGQRREICDSGGNISLINWPSVCLLLRKKVNMTRGVEEISFVEGATNCIGYMYRNVTLKAGVSELNYDLRNLSHEIVAGPVTYWKNKKSSYI